MAEDLKTKVTIGADTAQLSAGFTEAATIVKERSATMVESLGSVRDAVESLASGFELLAGGVLGALGLGEFSKQMTDAATSVRSLALAMGTSVEDASVLKSQLNTIGASADTFVGALDHLARQIKTNEDGINALGIATRNADGTTRDSKAVMLDALRAIQQYKPGLDQAQAAMYFFGRSVEQVRELMPLLSQSTEEATAKTEALGLKLSKDQVAAVNVYKVALNESKEVVEGAFNAIGQKLLPVLTTLTKQFVDAGPSIVQFANFLGSLLGGAVKIVSSVFQELVGVIRTWTVYIAAAGAIAFDAIRGDWGKVKADWQTGLDSLADISKETKAKIQAIWADPPKGLKDPLAIDDKGKKPFPAPTKDDLSGRDAVLQAQLAGEVAIVKEYVKEEDTELKRGYKDGLISLQDYYSQRLALSQLELDTEISVAERLKKAAEERAAAAASGKDDKAVQAALADQIKLENQLIVLRQKRAAVVKESAAAEADAERDLANKVADIRIAGREKADLAALDSQKKLIEYEQRLGQISNADAVAAYRNLEDQRYRIAVQAAKDRAALEEQNPILQAKLAAQLEALETEHQDKLTDIVLKSSKERADIEQKAIDTIQSGFAQLFDNIATGQKSLSKSFQDFFNSIFAQMEKLASEDLAKRMFGALGVGTGTSSAGGGVGGFAGILGSLGSLFSGPQGADAAAAAGVFELGTAYVPKTGLAIVHQGERVLTRQENLKFTGDTVHVQNNFNVTGEMTYESRATIASQVGRSLQAARRNL